MGKTLEIRCRTMIIDFHTHTFPERIAATALKKMQSDSHSQTFSDGTAAGLLESMSRHGIHRSVVLPVATNPLKVSSMNDLSVSMNQDGSLIYFGCIHPDMESWHRELGRIAELGLKGIKIHPVYQGADIDDIRFLRILGRAAELGLIVVTHAGDDIGFPGVVRCSPEMIRSAISQVGSFPFVLAHMGGWKNWDRVAGLLADTGVYLDTSFSLGGISPIDSHYAPEELSLLIAEDFCALVRSFGAERILFGTDSPWSCQGESRKAIEALPLTPAEIAAILGGNAQKLLKL